MKKSILFFINGYFLLLAFLIGFGTGNTIAQVRQSVSSLTLAEQEELAGLILEFLETDVIGTHSAAMDMGQNNTLPDELRVHQNENFLPFHRAYIAKLEDFLILKNASQYVPLPKWTPETVIPEAFWGVSPNCSNAYPDVTESEEHPPCPGLVNTNANPSRSILADFFYPSNLPNRVDYENLCQHTEQEILGVGFEPYMEMEGMPGMPANSTITSILESPWHNFVHNNIGGIMMTGKSPAAVIFWIWHAYVDDVWKEWDCNCNNAPAIDLWMQDSAMILGNTPQEINTMSMDKGIEPNSHNTPMWQSEDIWIRTSDDGFTTDEHQNPVYYEGQNTDNYVYVRVRNRGCTASSGTEEIALHWSKAGTSLSYPNHWIDPANGGLQTSNNKPLGGLIGVETIPVIPAGGSTIVKFVWQPVDPEYYVSLDNSNDPLFWIGEPQPHHFCLLARIEGTEDPITFTNGSNLNNYVKYNNNVVWKNVSVIEVEPKMAETGEWLDDLTIGAAVFVGDVKGTGGVYDFEFANPEIYKGNPVTAEAEVSITLSNLAWHKWENGGFQSENIEIAREERNKVIVTGNPAKLKNIAFSPNEFTLMSVGFNFLSRQVSGQTDFSYLAIQRNNADSSVVGGETYKIKVPGRQGFYANAGNDRLVSQYANIDLEAEDIGEPAIYNWYDQNGNLIYTGKDFTVSAEITEKYKLEVIATDGLKDYDEVEVKVKLYELFSMYPNPANSNVSITYNASSAGSAYLILQ
ncbi:MAG: tyrosinase family protein [Flavobacteriaceae bacterium]